MSSWVTLNVGGQKFETNTAVFMSDPECMLAKMFSGEMKMEMDGYEDGAYIITPPKLLVVLGIAQESIVWKLNSALYGLKRAPKTWELTRDEHLKNAL